MRELILPISFAAALLLGLLAATLWPWPQTTWLLVFEEDQTPASALGVIHQAKGVRLVDQNSANIWVVKYIGSADEASEIRAGLQRAGVRWILGAAAIGGCSTRKRAASPLAAPSET